MKKLVAYTSLLFFTFVMCFGFKLNADAACEGYDYNKCRAVSSGRGQIVVGGSGSGLYGSEVTKTYKSAADYSYKSIGVTAYFNRSGNFIFSSYKDSYTYLYCLDAQYVGTNPLYASRFLLDTTYGVGIQAMDTALLSILTGNGGAGTLASSTNITDYWARLIAMRAVIATFGTHNTASGSYNSAYYAGLTAVNNFLSHSATKQAYDELHAAFAAMGESISVNTSFSAHRNYYFSGSPLNTAEAYYVAALKDATEFVKNFSNGAKVDTDSIVPVSTEIEKTENSEGTLLERDVTHTIIVSGLPNNGKNTFVINGIQMDEVPEGLKYYIKKIKIGDSFEYETTNEGNDLNNLIGVNLLGEGTNLDFKNETKIEITVHFSGYEESDVHEILKCGQSEIKYSVSGTYSTEVDSKYSEYVATIWYSGTDRKQRYLGIERAGDNQGDAGDKEWTSPYTTQLIDACDCDDLIEACVASGSLDSEECQELFEADCGECAELEVECSFGNEESCQKYGEVCEVECPTTVQNFDCCDVNNNLIISDADDHEVNILGPEDVKACFVSQIDAQVEQNGANGAIGIGGAVDEKENSYTLKSDNKYCLVSCKEDYMMTMPTAKLVNAGRYFTFKAAVKGEKFCYTNTINKGNKDKEGSYVYDIADAQEKMVDAYNEFRKWEELAKANIEEILDTYPTNPSCSSNGCSVNTESAEYYPTMEVEATVSDWQTITNIDFETGVVSTSSGAHAVSDSSEHQELVGEDTYECEGHRTNSDGTTEPCEASATYYTGFEEVKSIDEYRQELEAKRDAAKATLIATKEAYEAIINEFADCTNDSWTSKMNYNPDIYYNYEEDYLADMYNNRGEMDKTINSETTDNLWYCIGTLGDATYEVCSGSQLSDRDSTLVNREYWVCEPEERCHVEERQEYAYVSDADYAKKTSDIDVSYVPSTLFYNVYPSGEIVDKSEGESRDDVVALENKLPVALSTERGIYKYTVNMTDLGEFYDVPQDGNLGRLIGGDTAVINSSDYADYVNDEGYVEYACSYLVNMGITGEDTIICDFDTDCEGDDCIADCIGPNCDYECFGDDCIADCIGAGCIYDSDAGTSLIEKVVSLNNLFPNGTNSYNWDRSVNDKADVTVSEIEELGNAVYDEQPILSVTITPSVARAIREYNDNAEGDGGYSNSSLSCYALNGYEEIACYSNFITDLLNGSLSYDDSDLVNGIDVVNDRSLIINGSYRTVTDDNTEYFTPWSGGISEEYMIGPSWK